MQSMGHKGNLWFNTCEIEEDKAWFVQFTVGNSGSFIPAEELPKLFEAFYTKGKRGGTGLGLAIAQKIVNAHGGRIWCTSSRDVSSSESCVEFHFTLPLVFTPNSTTSCLPKHSRDIEEALERMANIASDPSGSLDKNEAELEKFISEMAKSLGRKIKVLAVDDESVYLNSISSHLRASADLVEFISVSTACNGENALLAATTIQPDLVVLDVDLGRDSLNGFEVAERLSFQKSAQLVCIHSNRILASDHRTALESGADAFLPKPMGRAQLLKLVLQSVGFNQKSHPI